MKDRKGGRNVFPGRRELFNQGKRPFPVEEGEMFSQ